MPSRSRVSLACRCSSRCRVSAESSDGSSGSSSARAGSSCGAHSSRDFPLQIGQEAPTGLGSEIPLSVATDGHFTGIHLALPHDEHVRDLLYFRLPNLVADFLAPCIGIDTDAGLA